MILIITKSDDPTVDFVSRRLSQRGIYFERLNTDTLQQTGTISISPELGDWNLQIGKRNIRSYEVSSVWLRMIPRPTHENDNPEIVRYVTQEWELCWKWCLNSIKQDRIIDSEWKITRAANKFLQLQIATQMGLKVPKTLVTTNAEDFYEFYESNERTVVKTLGGFGTKLDNTRFKAIYTNRVSTEDMQNAESLKLAPVIFQEEIEKSYEVRATLVGSKLFSCKIESQRSERTTTDWRKYDFKNVPHSPIELPKDVEEKLKELARHFGIRFASFDLAVSRENEIIFFEMNPNSQWVWIEKLTGLQITDALIDLLSKEKGALHVDKYGGEYIEKTK